MTFTVPVWLLWLFALVIGVPALISLSVFALIGYLSWRLFRHGMWK